MRKALLLRFAGVLLFALIISSFISYYFIGHQLLANNIESLNHTIQIIDVSMDYEKDMQEQLMHMDSEAMDNTVRITIMDQEGIVLADSKVDALSLMDNHLERVEVQDALLKGMGYATRWSDTLGENLLYVAKLSSKSDAIIRIAIPFTGIFDYMRIILPTLAIGMSVSFLISVVVTARFTATITSPLREIADEMQRMPENEIELRFPEYRYKELNVISETTSKLTGEIKAFVNKLQFEKKIRQEFFSNASHELKTPITSIRGYAELLEGDFVKDEETKKDFIARIIKETDNMTSLINDILMISRLETKEAEVTFSTVRIKPLVKEIFDSLEPQAMENQVTLHSECDPVAIEASAKQMRELIMNLVGNGITYNHAGGNVWVTVRKRNKWLEICVKDDGMGIAPLHKERVFERFYRVDKGRSKKMGGTGLGLSIVKHIVEFYEGQIQLVSEEGRGSTFTIQIPVKREVNKEN